MFDRTFLRYLGLLSGLTLTVWSFLSGLLQGLMGYIDPSTFGPKQALAPLPALFLACLLNAWVVLWITRRTALTGRRLGLLIFTVVFGVMFLLPQMETVYFNDALQIPWGVIGATLVSGGGMGLVAAKVAARFRQESPATRHDASRPLPLSFTLSGLVFLAFLYVVLYFTCGYFIAWRSPAVRLFYAGTQALLPFGEHLQHQAVGLFVLQGIRGLLWAAIGCAVAIHLPYATPAERMVLVGLALSVGLAFPILVPNPYLPWTVRRLHFIELLTENFLLGVVAAWIFGRKSTPPPLGPPV